LDIPIIFTNFAPRNKKIMGLTGFDSGQEWFVSMQSVVVLLFNQG
jgi:hypothetical protein